MMQPWKIVLGVVVALLLVGGVGFVISESMRDDGSPDVNQQTRTTANNDAQPVLKNLGGITLGAYNASTGQAGDIAFSKDDIDVSAGLEMPVFLFGQALPRRNPDEPQRLNPNLEFAGIATPINLVAAFDGVVAFVKQQPDSADYEVFLSPEENSPWVLGYDHVSGVTVKRGDAVKTGQTLGQAAKYKSSYRYELQINNEGADTMHCPVLLLDPTVQQTYATQLTQFAKDWDEWYGEAVYPTHDGGCLQPSLTAAESEGR